MKLRDFLKEFSRNNLIRLHYKIKGGHQCVLDSWDKCSMDWQILKGEGDNRHFIDNEVVGIVGISQVKVHDDAINIVIEKLEDQPYIQNKDIKTCEYNPEELYITDEVKLGIDFTTFIISIPLLQHLTHDCIYINGEGEEVVGKVIALSDYINLGNGKYETAVKIVTYDTKSYFIKLI